MSLFPEQQEKIDFPLPLAEKYRPRKIEDFIGLPNERKVLGAFCKAPRDGAWLFTGASGLGKTTMALAMAEEMNAQLHHIPSQKCTVDNVDEVIRMCWYGAYNFKTGRCCTRHLVLVDEADKMSSAAQLALLSKLDSTARPPQTVFVFTCNEAEGLEKRFLSRCWVLKFSNYGLRAELAEFLAKVWERETGKPGTIDFERIAKTSTNNVRDALMALEVELLAA
jgi:replication-associated recombination protein RarA